MAGHLEGQELFNLLPLSWDSEQVKCVCEPFKRGVLVSYSPLALPVISPAGFQNQLRELIFPVPVTGAGVPDVGLEPLTL